MKHLRTYSAHVDEMAMITKKGKNVYVDGKPMKSANIEDLGNNTALYHEKTGNWMVSKGKFWLWFADTPEWITKLKAGEYEMLMFPIRTRFNIFDVAPITDVWKKKWLNKTKGSEHVIGLVEGFEDEKTKKVYIEMMSVKPGYKMNRINTHMMNIIKDAFKDYTFVFEDPTEDGYLFAKKYVDNPEFRWTSTYRPKEYRKDHPEEEKKVAIKEEPTDGNKEA